jgi:hypothetical protein
VAFFKKRSDDYQEPTGRAIIQVNDATGENSIGKSSIYPPGYNKASHFYSSFIPWREPCQAT